VIVARSRNGSSRILIKGLDLIVSLFCLTFLIFVQIDKFAHDVFDDIAWISASDEIRGEPSELHFGT